MGLARKIIKRIEDNFNPLQMTKYNGDYEWLNSKLVPKLKDAKVKPIDLMSLEKHKGLVSIEVKNDIGDDVKKTFIKAGLKDVQVVKGSKSWTAKVVGKYLN